MFPLTSKMNDKFPLTQDINSGVSGHVETVVLLSKLKHNAGMKVSNLYISQVKRKCGIELERIIIYLKMKIAGKRSVQKIKRVQLRRH